MRCEGANKVYTRRADSGFLPPTLSARYSFSQRTLVGTRGNGRDAPSAVIPALAPERGSSTLKSHSSPRERMIGSAEKRTFTRDYRTC